MGNVHQIVNHKRDMEIKILEALCIKRAVYYPKKSTEANSVLLQLL